jgi:hypothetical protein
MSKNSKDYETPKERLQNLMEELDRTLHGDNQKVDFQELTETWRESQKNFDSEKTRNQ